MDRHEKGVTASKKAVFSVFLSILDETININCHAFLMFVCAMNCLSLDSFFSSSLNHHETCLFVCESLRFLFFIRLFVICWSKS